MGLHREPDPVFPVSISSELRRRLIACVFSIDKEFSILTGRPPALSYRYTHFKLPLDLNDETLMQGTKEIARAVAALDANGWNTTGEINTSTSIRALSIMSRVRDEILELTLGDPTKCSNECIEYVMVYYHCIYVI